MCVLTSALLTIPCRLHEIAILLAISGSGANPRADEVPDEADTNADGKGSSEREYLVGKGVSCVLSVTRRPGVLAAPIRCCRSNYVGFFTAHIPTFAFYPECLG